MLRPGGPTPGGTEVVPEPGGAPITTDGPMG